MRIGAIDKKEAKRLLLDLLLPIKEEIKNKMKNLKFRIHSEEHSKAIQTRLFELGYRWVISGKNHLFLTEPFIYCNEFGDITFGDTEDFFKKYSNKEATLDDLYKDDREVLTIEEVEQRFNVKVKLK